MKGAEPGTQVPYTLRAPTSGPGLLDPRSALLAWGVGSVMLGVVVSVMLVQGQVRLLVLMLLGLLGLACLSPRRGIYILTIFLPFMYLLRRVVLNFQEFEQRDPILVFPALTAVAMFLGILIFRTPLLVRCFARSAPLKAIALLAAVFALAVFNPLQGSLPVGLAGAMYFIVPLLWCAFGLLLTTEDMSRIIKVVMVIGLLTALYGLWQHYVGMLDVEVYELKSKEFYKTFGGSSSVRVMSTFASLGDFSLYLMVSGCISFAYFWKSKRNLFAGIAFAINVYCMLWIAVRSAFLTLLFSMMMLVIIHGQDKRRILLRGAAALMVVSLMYGVLYSYDPQRMYDTQFSSNPYVVHTLSGITHPTEENSLQQRVSNWAYIVGSTTTQYPLWGRGLGSTTTAARKFEGGKPFEADSYFFELFYGSGVIAPIVFVFVVFSILRRLLRLAVESPDVFIYKLCLGLLCGIFLGSVFGLAARDTIAGPFTWLIVGWAIREDLEQAQLRRRPAEVAV